MNPPSKSRSDKAIASLATTTLGAQHAEESHAGGMTRRLVDPPRLTDKAITLVDASENSDAAETVPESSLAKPAVTPTLTVSAANLKRAGQIAAGFRERDEESDAGERLLLELVGDESALAFELNDVEGALLGLLGRTVASGSSSLALEVTKALREVVHVNNTVRRRIQSCLECAENLKAQRRFVRAHRGGSGV